MSTGFSPSVRPENLVDTVVIGQPDKDDDEKKDEDK